MNNFLVHNEEVRKEMLHSINKSSIEDLFIQIPEKARMQALNLEEPLSEMETQKKIRAIAKKNNIDYINFLGAGVYNKFIPACINQTLFNIGNSFTL